MTRDDIARSELADLLNSRAEAILYCDRDDRALFFNPAYACLMRDAFQVAVRAGEPVHTLLPAGHAVSWARLRDRVLSGARFALVYPPATTPDGGRLLESSFGPVIKDGEIVGFSEFILDVTHRESIDAGPGCRPYPSGLIERPVSPDSSVMLAKEIAERKQAEEDLIESRERLSQILQATSIPTFVIDTTHTITHWNKACERLTGFASREMVGTRDQWKAFYLCQRPTMADLVVDSASEKEIFRFYDRKYRQSSLLDGAYEAEDFFDFGKEEKWLFFTAAPIKNRSGEIIGAIETLQDVTERKRMEREIRQINDELEERVEERTMQLKLTYRQLLHAEKLSAIGKLAASIAHEFGNPIIGIRNFLQGLRKDVALDPTDAEMLDVAIQECVRVKDLINNLQNFNRPTSGSLTSMDIHQAINDLLVFCKKKFRDKNIRVVKDFAKAMPEIQAVQDQIKQVILNCLNNAEEAMPEAGGTIRISTAVADETIYLRIQDSGKGISEEDIDHIFEPFFSTKPAVEGTGLGLSVSYGILRRHGGNIEVESTPGVGTTFTITLPVKAAPKGADAWPLFNSH